VKGSVLGSLDPVDVVDEPVKPGDVDDEGVVDEWFELDDDGVEFAAEAVGLEEWLGLDDGVFDDGVVLPPPPPPLPPPPPPPPPPQDARGSTYCWSPADGQEATAAPGASIASIPSAAISRTVIFQLRMARSIAIIKIRGVADPHTRVGVGKT
jgi:hypothetical protein